MRTTTDHSRRLSLAEHIRREWYVVSGLLLVLTALLVVFRPNVLSARFDNSAYDLNLKLSPFSANDDEIALILIDNHSISDVGYWPWRRSIHAQLLEQLSESKAVAFDVLFEDPNPAYPLDDLRFAQAIAEHGRVVLPMVLDIEQQQPHPPLSILANEADQIGFINIFPGSDGVVRSFLMRYRFDPHRAVLSHIVPALLKAGGDDEHSDTLLALDAPETRYIPFSSTAKPYTSYSYADVLNGRVDRREFAGKYVLIGAWSSGLGDVYPTPISKTEQSLMPGVEVLAYGLHSALHNYWIVPAPLYINLLFNLAPVFLLCVALTTLRPRYALLATLGMILLIFIANWLFLHLLSYRLSITSAVLFSLLAYPLWHWRSQETTLRYVDNELAALSAQDPSLRIALTDTENANTLPARLSFLQHGIGLIREAQQRRAQTLHFISHDMRSPQNAILALIALQKQANTSLPEAALLEKISAYASNTLALVDDFMDLAKAEAMELEFTNSNMCDVIAEICDDVWPKAQQKQISVHFAEPERPVFVDMVPSIMKRAISNLLNNALQYSDPNTVVVCELKQDDAHTTLRVRDQGWGIPEASLATIFEPFERAHQQHDDAPTGTGIGLAFVETVVLRHHGSIHVNSTLGQGTVFTITLPNRLQPTPAHH